MTAISVAMLRGVDGFQLFDGGSPTGTGIPASGSFSIGSAAPTSTFDFEVRWNLTDANGAALTKKDIDLLLRAVQRLITEQLQQPAGTYMFAGMGI